MKKSMVSILLVMALLFTTTLVGFAGNRGDFYQGIQQKYSRQISGPVSVNVIMGSEEKIDSMQEPAVCRLLITRTGRFGRANFRNEKGNLTASVYDGGRVKFTGVRGTSGTLVSRQEFNRTRCL